MLNKRIESLKQKCLKADKEAIAELRKLGAAIQDPSLNCWLISQISQIQQQQTSPHNWS